PPSDRKSSKVDSTASASRTPHTARSNPSAASEREIPSPIPRAPPVTSATRLALFPVMLIFPPDQRRYSKVDSPPAAAHTVPPPANDNRPTYNFRLAESLIPAVQNPSRSDGDRSNAATVPGAPSPCSGKAPPAGDAKQSAPPA